MIAKIPWSFFFAHSVSKISNALIDIFVITFSVDFFATNPKLIGILMFFKYIPYVIFGIYGGKISDIYNRINIIYKTEICRAIFSVIFYISIYYHSFYIMCLSLFFLTASRCFYQPSQQSLIADLFEERELKKINSIFQSINEISDLFGPILLGIVVYLNNGKVDSSIVVICALLYLLSYFIFFAEREKYYFDKNSVIKNTNEKTKYNLFSLLSRKNKLFCDIFGSSICIFFISSLFKIVFPLFIVKFLGLSNGDISKFYIFLSLGTICSTFYIFKKGLHSENTMLFWILYALFIAICFLSKNILIIYLMLFIAGWFGAIVDICLVTNIQKYSDKNNIGKNFGFFHSWLIQMNHYQI